MIGLLTRVTGLKPCSLKILKIWALPPVSCTLGASAEPGSLSYAAPGVRELGFFVLFISQLPSVIKGDSSSKRKCPDEEIEVLAVGSQIGTY